jgi:hypothetical protein
MLTIAGYINIVIAFAHLVGLIWADAMFKVTGIEKDMKDLSNVHSSFPYLLTIFVAIVFFIFGLYGLSADNKIKKLPYLMVGIFLISGIYLFRGIGELVFDTIQGTNSLSEIIYSLVATIIGILYLFGGLKKWKLKNA